MEVRFFKKSERQLLLDSIDKVWQRNYAYDRAWRQHHAYVRMPEVLEHFVLNTPYRAEFAGEDNYSYIGMWDDDGQVVGILGVIPQRFNFFGKEYPSTTSTIWAVDKATKRKGKPIDGLSMSAVYRDKVIWASVGLALRDDAYRVSEAFGNCMIKDLPRWIAINNKDAVLEHLLPEGTNPLVLPDARPIDYDGGLKISVDELTQSKWDDFYFNVFAPETIGTQRDYRFLKWRYMESPVLKYRFVTVSNDAGEYLGLAVIRYESIMDGQFAIGRILEFICLQSEASIALANAVLKTFPNVIAWDFYCLSDITAFGLEAVGFRKVPIWMDQALLPTRLQPIELEPKRLKINGSIYLDERLRFEVNNMANVPWYITKGDADQDRAN